MERLTRHQAAVIGAYTGVLCGDFSSLHEYIEKVVGRPIWIHELASKELSKQIREAAKPGAYALERKEAMNFGLRRQLKGVTLTETPNRLPGSPEMIAAEIAEVERDIAEWRKSISEAQKVIRDSRRMIEADQTDIAYAEGGLRLLKAQLAQADRRKHNVPVPFPERRMVDSIIKRTE